MKLKVDKKQIPLVLGLLAVIAAILVYFFVYQKYQEKITALESSNSKLQSQVDDLTGKINSREFYETELERMELGIQKAYNCFPPMIEEEDAVLEAMRLEALAPMHVSTIDFQDTLSLYTVGTGETGGAPPAEVPADEAVGETTVEQDVAAAQAGETTNYGELQVPDLNFSSGMLPAGYQGDYGPISLNENVVNLNFTTSYAGLKRTLEYFITNPNRRTIQNISLGYDETTGLLTVAAMINEYSLTGTGKVYEFPYLPAVSMGTSNVFGGVDLAEGMDLAYLLRGGNAEGAEGEAAQQEQGGQENGQQNANNAVNKAGNLAAELPTVINPAQPAAPDAATAQPAAAQ